MNKSIETQFRKLRVSEINRLERQGCFSEDWSLVDISIELDLNRIRNVRFSGRVKIHKGVSIFNVPGGLRGCTIKEDARIENVASLEFDEEALHGVSTSVAVLDESGSRSVPIFPGLSSQLATLIARCPGWKKKLPALTLKEYIDSVIPEASIGERAIIRNSGTIRNVSIGPEVIIEGASRLENGSLINNAAPGKSFTFVGSGVDAENFILEDARLESKSIINNCYIGQGTIIGKGFSAQDSLIFSNCSFENGESHSLLAGPFTVSMHKGTLLIGCQTSFMNAGSTSNQSNHMYKLGPVHWGVMERGVKTGSGSYLMLGAKIGVFSLVMGAHKTHPDSTEFPFSYLFGDERGATVVVPAIMLRSCGLLRDEMKWPNRDRRLKRKLPLFDHITYDVLNPYTVNLMLNAIPIIETLLSKPADDDLFMRYKGMKFTRAALERAKNLYSLAIFKYLSKNLPENKFPESDQQPAEAWVDLGGQIMPRSYLEKALESESIEETFEIFDEAYIKYEDLQLQWIGRRFNESWRERSDLIPLKARLFDEMVEEDRHQYMQKLDYETEMLSL